MHAFYWPKIQNLIKAKRNRKCKIPHKVWERRTLRFNSYKNHKLKIKPWWVAARKRKKMPFSVPSIISEENFFKICKQIVYWIHFQNIHIFTYQKTSYHTLLLLVSKIVESLHCILKFRIVFKCLKTFNLYLYCLHARQTIFTKTFKTFTNFVWIEIFCVYKN